MKQLIAGLLMMSLLFLTMACSSDSRPKEEEYQANVELHGVRLAVAYMMAEPRIPVSNLSDDKRIASFRTDKLKPTNDMTDGGLITLAPEYFADSGTVHPVSFHLGQDYTQFYYVVGSSGKVAGFYDDKGKEKMEDKT